MKNPKQALVLFLSVTLFAIFLSGCKKKGCVDIKATNFDSEAMVDDGSCDYGYSGGGTATIGFYKSSAYSTININVYIASSSQFVGSTSVNSTNLSPSSCSSSGVARINVVGNTNYYYEMGDYSNNFIGSGTVYVPSGSCKLTLTY